MRLYLKNIGKIKTADIKINGITVLAGENDTGKSTVGKVLYSFFMSFHDLEQKIRTERIESMTNLLLKEIRDSSEGMNYPIYRAQFYLDGVFEEIVRFIEEKGIQALDEEVLKDLFVAGFSSSSEERRGILNKLDYVNINHRITSIMSIAPIELSRVIFTKALQVELNEQINNIFNKDPGMILLDISGREYKSVVEDNKVVSISDTIDLFTDVVYIDDPYVLDESFRSPSYIFDSGIRSHRHDLRIKLSAYDSKQNLIDEVLTEMKLDEIMVKLNTICSGEIIRNRKAMTYSMGDGDKFLDVRNLSMGLKTFVILKTLLLKGIIEEEGTVIMDEPEIHLHPEWQVRLAELIVLIQKNFGLHVLITTHSPYFLNAIEVFSKIHGISDKCHYYLASVDAMEYATIEEVTDHVELIYKKLAKPFQELENMRYQDE